MYGVREPVVIHLTDVELEDLQLFLELVYTGKVAMGEARRESFTALLELLSVRQIIGLSISFAVNGQLNSQFLMNFNTLSILIFLTGASVTTLGSG